MKLVKLEWLIKMRSMFQTTKNPKWLRRTFPASIWKEKKGPIIYKIILLKTHPKWGHKKESKISKSCNPFWEDEPHKQVIFCLIIDIRITKILINFLHVAQWPESPINLDIREFTHIHIKSSVGLHQVSQKY